MKSQLFGALCAVLLTVTTLSANAALIAGPGGVYDTDLDITWLLDANAGAGSTFDDDGESATDGRMPWGNANAWAASLDINGVTGWRLPTTTQPDASCSNQMVGGFAGQSGGTGCTGSEMGHLFNVEGITDTAPGPFSNVQQSDFYWSGTEFAPNSNLAWLFSVNDNQLAVGKGTGNFAWAVHSGDVSAIPVPAAVWLFGSGMLGLLGLARRQR